ncbi:MAG: NAD-dependent epimerase/dehydratase family protein, partial [Deltaproteobacteria bacterium]|nr:NAD-dependent epimerase/dehydratase family protein [Deltaproteobacteria bacterium]
TGATGFIGGNLVRTLVRRGFNVRVLVRSLNSSQTIDNLDVEKVIGDLRDPDSLEKACDSCSLLFHTAAFYQLWSANRNDFYDINVTGTKNILAAAQKKKLQKIVYTSTVGTIPYPDDPNFPSDETCFPTEKDLCNDYKRSKFQAEEIVKDFARCGLPVVIVNPSAPIGAMDVKPTPTGKIIIDFLQGKIPAIINTGLNVIDVEDVVEGHILAADKGKVGERYILGHRNLSLLEIYETIARLTGRPAPRWKIPYRLALCAAYGSELVARLSGGRPKIPLGAVRMASKYMYFSSQKAVRELGLPQSPIENAFRKSIHWFETNGYLVSKHPAAQKKIYNPAPPC